MTTVGDGTDNEDEGDDDANFILIIEEDTQNICFLCLRVSWVRQELDAEHLVKQNEIV